jgi:hypothetical protein
VLQSSFHHPQYSFSVTPIVGNRRRSELVFDCWEGEGTALVEGAHYFFGGVSGDQRTFGYGLNFGEWGEGFGVDSIPEVLDCLVGVVVGNYLTWDNVD